MGVESRKYNVLVTSVGAIVGYGIVRALRRSSLPVNIVGMDIYSDAVGQFWSDDFLIAKPAADEGYLSFLLDEIKARDVDLVFFGNEAEMNKVNADRKSLGCYSDKFVLNREEVMSVASDKWATYQFLMDHGLQDIAIPSSLDVGFDAAREMYGLPFIVKPRCECSSKGIMAISNAASYTDYRRHRSDFMVQKLIGDDEHEFTVAVFGTGDGGHAGSISLRRRLSNDGSTSKAWTVDDSMLDECVDRLTMRLKPLGPTNYQFRFENGRYYLLEINPRISASTSIRAQFGYNEPELCMEYFLKGETVRPEVKRGSAFRFVDEVVLTES